MQKRSFLSVFLLLIPLIGLTSCGKKKPKKDKDSNSQSAGRGLPLSGSKKTKRYDKDLEAFVLDDEDEEMSSVRLDGQNDTMFSDDDASRHAFMPIYFDFDKDTIRNDQEAALKADIAAAQDAIEEGKIIKVEGHADQHYLSELYNLGVSQRRAHTVANRLVAAGIDRNSVKAVGYGATRPVIDRCGQKVEENRRVELVAMSA